MIRILLIILFFIFLGVATGSNCFAEPASASQIQRSQELLEMEKALREQIEKGEKILIKKIVVQGVTLLTKDRVREIISPLENHWLTRDEIQTVLDLLKEAYKQKGYPNQPAKISYQIKKRSLIIEVKELGR